MNWEQQIKETISFLIKPELSEIILWIKYAFLFFGFSFLIFTLVGLLKTSFLEEVFLRDLKEFLTYKPAFAKRFLPRWRKIEKRLESGFEADLKLAILEADDLLKEGLRILGYIGKIDEVLEKLSEDIISNLQELKEARKIKEDIVEDPSYKISLEETKKILSIYEKSLKELQLL